MALLGSDMHQLDRLGRELKCPICLSLFKEAASLTCNHVFCRSCILQSMKGTPSCPICKVHTTRREVRAAPQMDSLVSIFASMGGAAGLDIMHSQNAATINETVQATNAKTGPSKNRVALSNITNCHYSRLKPTVRENPSECTFKGAIPAKKRIQVPLPSSLQGELEANGDVPCIPRFSDEKCGQNVAVSGPSLNRGKREMKRKDFRNETEVPKCSSSSPRKTAKRTRNQSVSIEKSIKAIADASGEEEIQIKPATELGISPSNPKKTRKKGKDMVQLPSNQPYSRNTVKGSVMPVKDDCSRRKLDPFFWLRDVSSQETEAIQVTQLTQTQSTAKPNFSDLKDSDDEDHVMDANEEFTNRTGVCEPASYDSDDFDWTQLPCSPEIKCSPSKNQKTQDDLIIDLPCEVPQALACEELFPNDQDLVEWPIQVEIAAKPLDAASKVDLIAQKNLNTHSKEIKKRRSNRARSVLKSAGNSIINIRSSQKENSGQKHILVEGTKCSQIAGNLSAPNIPFPEETMQFNETMTKKKKLRRSKMEKNKHADARDKDQSAGGRRKADSVAQPSLHVCVFCRSLKCSQITGSMMHYNQEGTPLEGLESKGKVVHVHKHCAEWAPDVYFVQEEAKNLNAEVVRGLKIKCNSCGKKGAALGCCIKRCRKNYHYPCARALSCRWDEDHFIMLCPEHKTENFPIKKRLKRRLQRTLHNPRTDFKADELRRTGDHNEHSAKWACGQHSKWVLCGSGLDGDGKAQLAAFAKITGATVLKSWSSNVTHMIAGVDQHGAARRTMKYLMAILEGKWIVKSEWLAACLEAGNTVSEGPYEISIDIHGTVGGPKQGRLLAAHKASKLFEKIQFYFMPDFSPSYKGDLQALVVVGGGVILHRKPVLLETDAGQTTVIVYNNDSTSSSQRADDEKTMFRRQEARNLALSVGACVVPQQWILDSIASSKLLPRD